MSVKMRAYKSVIGGFISTMLTLGSYAAMSVYLFPICEAFEASLGEVSLLFTFAAISGFLSSLVFGALLKKIGLRLQIIACAIALFSLYAAFAFAHSITLVYVGAFFFGIATTIGGFIVVQTEISWWFARGQGKLMGLVPVFVGVVGMLLPPVITMAIEAIGVRTTALVHGSIVAIVMVIDAVMLLSGPPSDYGMKPYGYVEPVVGTENLDAQQAERSLSIGGILRSAPFWMIMLAIFFVTAAMTGLTNNAAAFYQSIGMDAVKASLCVSVYSAAQMIWGPLFGALADKKGPTLAVSVCGLIGAAALFVGIFLTGFTGGVIIALLLGALNFSGMLGALCFPRMFGAKEAASLIGFGQTAGAVGPMIAPALASFIYDATGSYSIFLIIAGIMAILGIVLTSVATGKKRERTV